MSLLAAIVVFIVGLLSGTVVRWFAGLAAIVALVLVVLGVAAPQVGFVDYVLSEFYTGNELLFLSGFLFGVEAKRSKQVVTRRTNKK